MRFSQPIKEKVARVIADYFTTSEIVGVFTELNVPTDVALYAKWRITLDAFNKMSSPEETIPVALENFAHPLNFGDPDLRKEFVKHVNKVLGYAGLEIHATEFKSQVLDQHGFPVVSQNVDATPHKTPADYVKEAINFFKDEYNKVRMAGLTYEYALGETADMDGTYTEEYLERRKAIEQLRRIGFITELEYEPKFSKDDDAYDYAICKIDEGKLTQKEEPKATAAGAEAIAQRVIHEHTHRFENSIQEKDIALNHKFPEQKTSGFYINKKDDDFWYKGRNLNLSKNTDYYRTFAALYAKLPEGGEVSYDDLAAEIKSRLPKVHGKNADEMRKFIQRNLTDKSNGFMRYAGIPETEDNGKPLIDVVRGSGIVFNNKAG